MIKQKIILTTPVENIESIGKNFKNHKFNPNYALDLYEVVLGLCFYNFTNLLNFAATPYW